MPQKSRNWQTKEKFGFEFKSIVTNVLLLLTIIDIYGLDKSDYQMDSQNIKYAIIIFVCLDVKMLEHSAKISCLTNNSTTLK